MNMSLSFTLVATIQEPALSAGRVHTQKCPLRKSRALHQKMKHLNLPREAQVFLLQPLAIGRRGIASGAGGCGTLKSNFVGVGDLLGAGAAWEVVFGAVFGGDDGGSRGGDGRIGDGRRDVGGRGGYGDCLLGHGRRA